jgi:hypothetical protein
LEFTFKSKLSPVDLEQIEAFYNNLELTQIEQHPLWHLDIESKNVKYFIAYENANIVCYSVLYEKKTGPVGFVNIRFGPLCKDPEHLISSLIEIAGHYKKRYFLFISIQPALFTGAVADLVEAKFHQAFKFKNTFDRNNWSSIIIKLDQDVETIFKNFSSGHKGAIKKALKLNTVVRQVESKNDIKELAKVFHKMELYRKINSYSIEFIESQFIRIYDFLKKKEKGFVLVVIDDSGVIIGGTINIFQGKGIRYFKGAADPDRRDIPIMHTAIFEGIKIAKSLGFQYFDLWGYNHYVGKNDQVYNINLFKKGFGGEFIFYPKIMNIQLLPFGRFIYNTTMTVKKTVHRIFSSKNK